MVTQIKMIACSEEFFPPAPLTPRGKVGVLISDTQHYAKVCTDSK